MLDDGDKVVIGANWDVTRDIELQEGLRAAEEFARLQNVELENVRKELEHQATHDMLTGLPNRRGMEQFVTYIQGRPLAEKTPVACLHIDLDRFKEVNDALGHSVGDAVLQVVAEKLAELAKNACFLCRIGGDEFMMFVALPEADRIANALASNVVELVSKPMRVGGRECRIGASVGVAVQSGGCDIARLIADADIALYEAKKRGRGRVRVFAPALRSVTVSNRQLADQILIGIDSDQFLPFFQLQFDAQTLEVAGAEALARWQHPELGMLSPGVFLPIAEEIGKLGTIDEIILEKSLRQFCRMKEEGVVVPKISVNVSAQRLRDESFLRKLTELSFVEGTLAFELLESISFDGPDSSLASAIDAVKELGIDIEIDDFGTGHASIVSLLELSPNRLKIDRKLTRNVESVVAQRKLVSSIIEIARTLGIETIAEGVESMRQAEILRDLGCNFLQGFALAKPAPGENLGGLDLPRYHVTSLGLMSPVEDRLRKRRQRMVAA
jgi:diguanylate cyclase (GGDEF)-like protein